MAKGGISKKCNPGKKRGKGNARANKWNKRARMFWEQMINRGKLGRSEQAKA